MHKVLAFISATLLGGVIGALVIPAIWFCEFWWNWVCHDNVIAINQLDASVRKGFSPSEAFGLGCFLGCAFLATGYIAHKFDLR